MKQISTLVLVVLLSACTTKTDVTSYDLTQRAGIYILGYTTDEGIRRLIENQLVADVRSREMVAFASHLDLPNLPATTRDSLLAAADAKQAMVVLVVNQVVPGESGVIENPLRVTPDHPDLTTFYEYTKSVERSFDPNREVFAEVNAFLIEGSGTQLIWSGTTWSFDADGEGGAIRGMSTNIAEELGELRDALLGD
jgi:hypothetical protein